MYSYSSVSAEKDRENKLYAIKSVTEAGRCHIRSNQIQCGDSLDVAETVINSLRDLRRRADQYPEIAEALSKAFCLNEMHDHIELMKIECSLAEKEIARHIESCKQETADNVAGRLKHLCLPTLQRM
jgi:hypothetical protein